MVLQQVEEQALAKSKKIAEVFLGMRGLENAFNMLASEFNSTNVYYAFGAGKLGGATTVVTVLIYLLLVYSLWKAAHRNLEVKN